MGIVIQSNMPAFSLILVIALAVNSGLARQPRRTADEILTLDEIKAMEEVFNMQEAPSVDELLGKAEVRRALPVQRMDEVLSQQVLDDLEEVTDIRRVYNIEELSRVKPVLKQEEVVSLREIDAKIPIPDHVARKFLASRDRGEGSVYETNQEIIDKMEVLSKKMVKKLQEIESLET